MKFLWVFCTLFVCTLSSYAADGKILKLKGTARVLLAKQFKLIDAKEGMEINSGDVVRTGKDSLVHLSLDSGRVALIKANSRFKIITDKKKQHINLEFDRGEFLVGLIKPLAKEESFRVRTPSAVVGVRGTLFWGLSDESLKSTYACFESKITVSAGGTILALNPGDKVEIPYGEEPGTVVPANVPLSYLDTFKVDDSLQGLQELLE